MKNKDSLFHIIKYIISGGTSAIVLLSLLYVFHNFIKLPVVVSSAIAYSISLCVGFLMQKFWTWKDVLSNETSRQFIMYVCLGIFNVGLNTVGMYVFVAKLLVWYLLAQIIVAGIIAVWSYVFYKNFVFVLRNN